MFIRIITCALFALAVLAPSTGCKHPYSGAPERLKKPRPKKPKKDDPAAAPPVVEKSKALDDKCRTNFFADPERVSRRNANEARNLAKAADNLLVEAERVEETDERVPIVTDAMSRLRSALEKDPYGPLPTYKLAVAYALVGKKGCALALLERLKSLQDFPPVEGEARRNVKAAVRDLAFDRFRDDARAALGE